MKETKSPREFLRRVAAWLGDLLPDPVGSWLLRFSDDSEEPWLDDEGRLIRR